MKRHLAIFSKEEIKQIFSGQKSIDIRFSKKKIPPFGVISIGDLVYIKPPGQDIVGQFKIKKVISFEGLDGEDLKFIKTSYGEKPKNQEAKFAAVIFMSEIEQFITSPIKISKKDSRGWVVLK